ncbi:uncharacterized protein MELLADRAFT_95436 [Melampsora larici-populina 98AG31]|uniref:Uncharacterized protein n=1 Tax=Melampsora larici-populina (strain 98AG31 / pathotype 3-4-7) TaxID=747676 RepID=F4S9B2_MELLP|nr:uncharacterized protein MELLADRAFT_95436 [Melampsora larici-populina 98AG31]EGF98796.1 hypothetical protein MELLADRAFT_95436 [Melampsora larici-populina 98AG31]
MPKSPKIFDPDAPGINKQAMLDWMHINHPMTPIKSGSSQDEVAKKVKEVQPQYFAVPGGIIGQRGSGTPNQTIESQVESSTSRRNVAQLRAILFKQSSSVRKRSPSPVDNKVAPPKKRSVSAKLTLSKNSTRPVTKKKSVHFHNTQLAGSQEGHHGQSATQNGVLKLPLSPSVEPKNLTLASDAQVHYHHPLAFDEALQSNQTRKDQKPRLLSNTQAAGSFVSSLSADLLPPKITPIKVKTEKDVTLASEDHISPEGKLTSTHEEDLIVFTDKDWLEADNIVNGRDIAPILPDRSTSVFSSTEKKRTGVEVFQDERRQVDQISAIEERINGIEVITNDWKSLQDNMENYKNKVDVRIKALEDAFQDFKSSVDSEVKKLKYALKKANEDIEAHDTVLQRMLSEGNDDDGHSEYAENDQEEDESSCESEDFSRI